MYFEGTVLSARQEERLAIALSDRTRALSDARMRRHILLVSLVTNPAECKQNDHIAEHAAQNAARSFKRCST